MGFWGALAGGAIGFLTGGPVGAAVGAIGGLQSDMSANAEKKAAKQQQQGYMQGVQAYQPYHTLGLQSANSLAHELGLEGIQLPPGGMMGGQMGPAVPREGLTRMPAQTAPVAVGRTLADLWGKPKDVAPIPGRSLPSGSGKRTLSSYRSAT